MPLSEHVHPIIKDNRNKWHLHSVVVLYSVYHPTGDKSTLSPVLASNRGVPRCHSNGAGRTPPLHPLLTRKPSILLLPQTLM